MSPATKSSLMRLKMVCESPQRNSACSVLDRKYRSADSMMPSIVWKREAAPETIVVIAPVMSSCGDGLHVQRLLYRTCTSLSGLVQWEDSVCLDEDRLAVQKWSVLSKPGGSVTRPLKYKGGSSMEAAPSRLKQQRRSHIFGREGGLTDEHGGLSMSVAHRRRCLPLA